jgi:hypothetical protein
VPPKAVIKPRVGEWHQPRTLQKPSISAPAETDPCFIGVFHARIHAMRSYVTENKTWPIFPSWMLEFADQSF